MAQHRIDGGAHDDASAHWPSNNLPVGMNTGTLAQVPASAAPVHRAEPSQAHPGSFGVPPYPRAEPSSSSAWFVPSSSRHTLAFPGFVADRQTSHGLPAPFPPLHNRRYPSLHIALSSLAIPPPGLPTGSKADASFEATGELSTWPLPFGDLALASWQKHWPFASQPPTTDGTALRWTT